MELYSSVGMKLSYNIKNSSFQANLYNSIAQGIQLNMTVERIEGRR